MTTSHTQAETAELHTRIHQLERDAEDRELVILALKARIAAQQEKLRALGVVEVPTKGAATKPLAKRQDFLG